MSTSQSRGGTGGILAILVIVVILLVGLYFLVFQGQSADKAGSSDAQKIEVEIKPPASGNSGGGEKSE